tara:strand:+ start:55620 stop:56369 length:750 start_codon:yes stop_codon:yes gene_type:complete
MRKVGNWWITDDDKMGTYLNNEEHVRYMDHPKDVVDFAMTKNICHAIEKHANYSKDGPGDWPKVLIDVGASYGIVTNRVAKLFDRVECFEVIDEVRDCLRLNVDNHSHVTVHPTGVSDRVRSIQIGVVPSHTMLSGVSINQVQYKDRFVRQVDVVPLDDYNISNPTCVKIDVEGHELHVLYGAKNTLKSAVNPCVVFVECWDKGEYYEAQTANVIKTMQSYGYAYCGRATNIVKPTQSTDDLIFKKGIR